MTPPIATLGPKNSHAWQAAHHHAPEQPIQLYDSNQALVNGWKNKDVNQLLVPIYNTREGESVEFFQSLDQFSTGYWQDNIILPFHLSLGVFHSDVNKSQLKILLARRAIFRQCEEYLSTLFPNVSLLSVYDINQAINEIPQAEQHQYGVIDAESVLTDLGLCLLEREVAPYNRTRFAIFGRQAAKKTGYDASVFITAPLEDRLGLLVDMLRAFADHGINLLDIRTENDIKTQKLRVYLEAEGHRDDPDLAAAIAAIETRVIQAPGGLRCLGSFPRVNMRSKHIKGYGFIGSGAMSQWFVDRLEKEGYQVLITGRNTPLRPEEMIKQVDVVAICVPISATSETIRTYAPLLRPGQGLILLAGESEDTLATALTVTNEGVEVMLVHNLWGPNAATMKGKNAIVVRTARSGKFCSEFESFLYKHGAAIYHDSAAKHDLLMGIGQKLPTVVSVALAKTLAEHQITADDLSGHCTLTSLYSILAMTRVHCQNPRTYAEIMATKGDGRRIVHDFARNLALVTQLADEEKIEQLSALIEENSQHLTPDFLKTRMKQASAVDEVLARMM